MITLETGSACSDDSLRIGTVRCPGALKAGRSAVLAAGLAVGLMASPAFAVPPLATLAQATNNEGAAPWREPDRPARAVRPQRVASCSTCGVVEAVRPIQVKGEASGLGAIAGGVVGGLLGNQVGSGTGRKAMTVVGAVGGGAAGHEIEKRARAESLYEVRVRMEDGSTRSFQQRTAPAVGARVRADGDTLRTLASRDDGSRSVRTGHHN